MPQSRRDKARSVAALGDSLRRLRTQEGLTVEVLGAILGLKAHRIAEYEAGKIEPGALLWCRWVKACTNVDPMDFWVRNDSP